ncbi:gliding motility-associated C-terminal domain-containing protein [Spirosoma fluviale]|uniref:gliding motility-associated C-terminal domain-containing protein n=1 Tax=Spirosoma fluviale TaxID=1597977 RepID=UPI001FEAF653|nr:gliding motility-associated C-terminal domain-containing protein [Spirosoma fluviale]
MVTHHVLAISQPVADTCQHPEPPVITGSAKFICRNEPVILTATGCAGTVVWSNGEAGFSIQVKPQQTTNYTAICRARPGCISCFADVWKVTVNTPDAPPVASSANVVCPGSSVTLTATNCAGTVRWADQTTGPVWIGKLVETATFQATCEQNNCLSNPSRPVSVQVATPTVPVLSASNREICRGQVVQLSASGCVGTVRWTDGGKGALRTVTPEQTGSYRAVCELGSCRSDSSEPVSIRVRTMGTQLTLKTSLSNGCPFQTVDLSKALTETTLVEYTSYHFRTGPALTSPTVQSPGAVGSGTYFIFGRTADGCYTTPVAVTVNISNCPNAIPACLSNPPTLALRVDSLDWTKGVVRMTALPGGSTQVINWQSDGGGLFTNTGLIARYLLSETDLQRGKAQFTLSAPDPDGDGPCRGASVQQTVMAPPLELIGLTKKSKEPTSLTGKEPTQFTLHSLESEQERSLFIPEGFSPNGDGINDRFVITLLPASITIQLEVFNRWGHLVYQNTNYQNDWDGTANQGIGVAATKNELPDGTYYYQIRLSDGREYVRFLTLAR